MSTSKRSSPALDDDHTAETLQAAEAEAAEAEAAAEAARARAERARQQAEAETTEDGDPNDAPSDATDGGEDTADASDDTASGTPSGKRRRPRWLRLPRLKTLGVAALIVITGAALAASGYIVWQHRIADQEKQRTAEFSAAARENAEILMALDHSNAQAVVQRVLDHSTGTFKEHYQENVEDLTQQLQESKVVAKATVSDVAVDSMTDDSAVVLVAARTEGTDAVGAPQQPRLWRIGLTLTRDDGQLKISDVEFVQ